MKEVCVGKNLVIDYYNCDEAVLNNPEAVKKLIHEISAGIEVNIVQEAYHMYAPVGVTGFAIVSESHISIHTWPEYNYLAVDIFSCKDIKVTSVFDALRRWLKHGTYTYRYFDRVSLTN